MTNGRLQLANDRELSKRVVNIPRPQRTVEQADVDDPLFINVLRRRWLLLTVCGLLSAAVAAFVAFRFELPKATTTGRLRYVSLPPALHDVYEPPPLLEIAQVLDSQENMADLTDRFGLNDDPKDFARRFDISASRFSNIIDVEFRWNDGQQAIDIVNELMSIACDSTVANRKQTLGRYRVDTELALEAANQRVVGLRDQVLSLRQQRDTQVAENGMIGTEEQVLMSNIARAEQLLDEKALRKSSISLQIATLQSDVEAMERQIKQELLRSRKQQVDIRQKLYNPSSPKAQQLLALEEQLEQFARQNMDLDYAAWQAKLSELGLTLIGPIDVSTISAIETMRRQLTFTQQKISQLELELLPLDGEVAMLEKRRESLERRLADALGEKDISSTALEEMETQMEEAQRARSRLQDQLDNIRRLEDTDFTEMTVLTPASWQTTETSDGKAKLWVMTFGGCFLALVAPVFALEHFFPSGDPAERAARNLGLPLVSRGAFVSQSPKPDGRQPQPVNSEAMRLLALRIQQSVPGSGALVLFSGLNHPKSAIPTISYLAECLARREEKVLIIDANDQHRHLRTAQQTPPSVTPSATRETAAASASTSTANSAPTVKPQNGHAGADTRTLVANTRETDPSMRGLSDFLHQRDLTLDDLVSKTSIDGVDIIGSGSRNFPREGLAASCLTEMLDECRRRYTILLVAGPATDYPSDLQMLSARADGILFTVPRSGRAAGSGEEVVRDLLDMGAPVIGIVS